MLGMIIRLSRRLRGRVAVQRMHVARIILLARIGLVGRIVVLRRRRRLLSDGGALHPGRRRRRRSLIGLGLLITVVARLRIGRFCWWLFWQVGATHRLAAERIGLSDQASKLSQRIAFGVVGCSRLPVAIVVATGRISPVLISLSHRDNVSPRGKVANPLAKKPTGPHRLPLKIVPQGVALRSAHLVRRTDAKNPKAGCQNRDDALYHR